MTDAEWTLCGLPVVERVKSEILRDIAAGIVPPAVASFADLHDHVDANEYGGACETDADTGKGWWDGTESERAESMAFWGRVQDAVNDWLASGRPDAKRAPDPQWGPVCPQCQCPYAEHHADCTVPDGFNDTGEGPWETEEQATAFAHAEVGMPWQVARGANGWWYVMVKDED